MGSEIVMLDWQQWCYNIMTWPESCLAIGLLGKGVKIWSVCCYLSRVTE